MTGGDVISADLGRGLVALSQCALDIHGVGDVLERHQRGPVVERHGGAIDHGSVTAFEPAERRLAIVYRRDHRPQSLPYGMVAVERPRPITDGFDVRSAGQHLG